MTTNRRSLNLRRAQFVATSAGIQILCALIQRALGNERGVIFSAMFCFLFLFMPCRDPLFGRGAPKHWVRQSMFVSSALICLAIGFIHL